VIAEPASGRRTRRSGHQAAAARKAPSPGPAQELAAARAEPRPPRLSTRRSEQCLMRQERTLAARAVADIADRRTYPLPTAFA